MTWLILVVLAGPSQTIAGKYVQHSEEFEKAYPSQPPALPQPLPADSRALCALIESGHPKPELFAALGEALLREGQPSLAYRAFHRAHRLKPRDGVWGKKMMEAKRRARRVPEGAIRAAEREASVWVEALKEYEREAIRQGRDPRDLAPFYERYGEPEDNVFRHVRQRRFSGAGGIVGILVGIVFLLGARFMTKRAMLVPLIIGIACALGPGLLGQVGLFYWGAGAAWIGAGATLALGRKRQA